jgi:hypothetical protein
MLLHHDGLSRPLESPRLRVLSLGAGVQSTTLALMAADGELGDMPDVAAFADTGWEPAAVYRHLDWLETVLPYPVVRLRRAGPDLGEMMLEVADGSRTESGAMLIPYFSGDDGMIPKQCSKEFKTRVVTGHVRSRMGLAPKQRGPKVASVEMWLGISTDEITRLKRNEIAWIHNRHPLIEARMNRRDCLAWLEARGYPRPPRSSCIFCPFRSNAEWQLVKDDPEDWPRLVGFDRAVRTAHPTGAYLLKSRKAVEDADFSEPDLGPSIFGFENECEGMCGV